MGDPVAVIALSGYSHAPHPVLWLAFGMGLTAAGVSVWRPLRRAPTILQPALFVFAVLMGGILLMMAVGDGWRRVAIATFAPDLEMQQSFLTSMRTSWRSGDQRPHAVLVKQCQVYAWSYSRMAIYEGYGSVAGFAPKTWFAPGTRCGDAPPSDAASN